MKAKVIRERQAENAKDFDRCLNYLVCPLCARDLAKETQMKLDSTGFGSVTYKCTNTKCNFTWER
jgi:hypothetical protein